MGLFDGIAGRVLALRSYDVYRASGILHGIEPDGPLQPGPITEDSGLRTRPSSISAGGADESSSDVPLGG